MTKRNHFLTLAIGIFASYCGAAETIVEHPVLERPTVAIQGGLSFANASTPGDMSSSTSTGLLLGVNVNFPLTPMFSFQPELMFTQRKATLLKSGGFNLSAKYNSIELPALAKVSIGEKIRPYLFAGPVAILNVSSAVEAEGVGTTTSANFKSRTFALAADIGVGLELGSIFGNLRYSLGLSDFDETNSDWESNGIQMIVGMKL